MLKYRHKKSGEIYIKLAEGTDCTNSRDGTPVVIYSKAIHGEPVHVRETAEFYEKFIPILESLV
jgi:hypothetical protein